MNSFVLKFIVVGYDYRTIEYRKGRSYFFLSLAFSFACIVIVMVFVSCLMQVE